MSEQGWWSLMPTLAAGTVTWQPAQGAAGMHTCDVLPSVTLPRASRQASLEREAIAGWHELCNINLTSVSAARLQCRWSLAARLRPAVPCAGAAMHICPVTAKQGCGRADMWGTVVQASQEQQAVSQYLFLVGYHMLCARGLERPGPLCGWEAVKPGHKCGRGVLQVCCLCCCALALRRRPNMTARTRNWRMPAAQQIKEHTPGEAAAPAMNTCTFASRRMRPLNRCCYGCYGCWCG